MEAFEMALCILAACAAIVLLISFCTYLKAFYVFPWQKNKTCALPGGEQYEKFALQSKALMAEMEALPYEQVFTRATDGVLLSARYYHVRDGAPLQIQVHGYRGTCIRDFCGGNKLAREAGYNTLVVEQRAQGNSGGHSITFGIKERYDCLCWVNYAAERFGKELPIVLSGVSMGGTTVLMASAFEFKGNVVGIVADSPFDSPEKIIRKVCRDMHFPPALAFPFIRLGARIFGGFDITAACASDAVKRTQLPILIIHGEDDRFVPCEMSASIQQANPERVSRATFPGAGHGLSYMMDFDRYAHLEQSFVKACCKQ